MKSLKLTLLALCALTIFSCKNKDKNIVVVDQDIPYTDTADMQGIGGGFPLPVGISIPSLPYSFATDYQTYLTQYHTNADLVNSVKLKSFGLEVLAPAGQDLSFLDTFRVVVYGNGLPDKLIAYKYGRVSAGTTKMDLTINDEELKPYFLQDSVHAYMSGFINAMPAAGTRLLVKSSFHLKATPVD